jgi:hypothetical protein
MSGGRIFSKQGKRTFSERAGWFGSRRETGQGFDIREAERAEIRKMERTLAGDVAQRIAAHVAVLIRVRHLADSNAVEDDPDDSSKGHGASVRAL